MRQLLLSSLAVAACGSAVAGITYPFVGHQNAASYVFTATSTGPVDAYFAGSTAHYDEKVGLLINGVSTGIVGLDDHSSTLGKKLTLGSAHAGDTLTFILYVSSTNTTWSSHTAANSDHANHVYSVLVTAGQAYNGSPAGTYVAFEDLPAARSDFNYHDDTFVFDNTTISTPPYRVLGP